MKLHRLLLRNWRGIDDRETRFAPTGVTVVEGPNESGKSSLLEALDALLIHLDNSQKQQVLAVKPVHKDVGAEVEAEIETGPYRFTYFKRFHRRPETKLVITQPVAVNLTGREAHERVRQMLEETVDLALWSALRIEQGQGLTQANLAHKTSLAAALDRAAGVARSGEDEETLHAAARAEFERYFTPTGVPRKETTEAQAAVARLEQTLAQGQESLAKLVKDIERSASLERERLDAKDALDKSAEQALAHQQQLREIERLDASVKEATAELREARLAAEGAARLATERRKLIDDDRDAAEAHAKLADEGDLTRPAFDEARSELQAAEQAHERACEEAEAAERTHAIAQQDLEYRRDDLDLQQLGERKQRADTAISLAAKAELVLTQNAVTDEALRKLQDAHLELEKARAALAAGSPELHVRALADIEPQIDASSRRLARGEELTLPVSGSTAFVLPGLVALEVRTGSSSAKLRDAFGAKQREFTAACRAAGVESLEHAVSAHAAWRSARRDVEARDEVVKVNLRDLTREQLERKVANLVPRVEAYPAGRSAPFAIAPDFDAARDVERRATSSLDAAKAARNAAEGRRNAARDRLERLREERNQAELARERAKTQAAMSAAALKEARIKASDADVEGLVTATRERLEGAEHAHRGAAERLAAMQPDNARLLAENSAAVHEGAQRRMREIEHEQIEVRARLKERGEEGLAEQVEATAAKLERAKDDLVRRQAHAAAAKLLFTTLDDARNEARRAYVAPLRSRIEELGRLVHGAGFAVELNDDLQITHRTLDARTVPFDGLSGGAKEQLALIARIACALLVADDGGVPVLIDDALGYSDATRLQAIGALLAFAGRRCQVIVLTCYPDRYRNIGGATVVRT